MMLFLRDLQINGGMADSCFQADRILPTTISYAFNGAVMICSTTNLLSQSTGKKILPPLKDINGLRTTIPSYCAGWFPWKVKRNKKEELNSFLKERHCYLHLKQWRQRMEFHCFFSRSRLYILIAIINITARIIRAISPLIISRPFFNTARNTMANKNKVATSFHIRN